MTDEELRAAVEDAALATGWFPGRKSAQFPVDEIPVDSRPDISIALREVNGVSFKVVRFVEAHKLTGLVRFDIEWCHRVTTPSWREYYAKLAATSLVCIGELSGDPLFASREGDVMIGTSDAVLVIGAVDRILPRAAHRRLRPARQRSVIEGGGGASSGSAGSAAAEAAADLSATAGF